ncbi:MAG: hypothetical protein PHO37_12890 [Kiritimatiellae bacterium]|nr:hypothetical protein [Kiritimatiellia bacterium]
MFKLLRQIKFLTAAVTLLMLGGCATPPSAENMIYTGKVSGKFNKALINEVSLAATTRSTSLAAITSSEISSETFDAALKESLQARGLYSESGRFQLQAHILKIVQPPGNFTMKATTHVQYTLVDRASGKVFFKESVIADHTAITSDAFTGIKRRRLALEGAGKGSIAQFLDQLSQL